MREDQKTGGNSKGYRDLKAKGRNGFQKKGRTNSLQCAGQIREGLHQVVVTGGGDEQLQARVGVCGGRLVKGVQDSLEGNSIVGTDYSFEGLCCRRGRYVLCQVEEEGGSRGPVSRVG